jgi:hypothetical protein
MTADARGGGKIRPLRADPDSLIVASMFDLRSEEWWLAAAGGYQTAAVEVMRSDGSDYDRLIASEFPCRRNHSDELRTIRLLISPDDAINYAATLAHSARWLIGQR